MDTPTHRSGHTLDLFSSRHCLRMTPEVSVVDRQIVDHFSVVAAVRTGQLPWKTRVPGSSRNIKGMPLDCLSSEMAIILDMLAPITGGQDVHRLAKQYFEVVERVLDKHQAPCSGHERQMKEFGHQAARVLRRSNELRWRRSGLGARGSGLGARGSGCTVRSS